MGRHRRSLSRTRHRRRQDVPTPFQAQAPVPGRRGASARATALSQAVRQGTHSRFERTLISLAWATGSLDDLFKVHGVTVGAALTDAARDLVSKDPLTTHLEAACAYSNSIAIPYIPAGP